MSPKSYCLAIPIARSTRCSLSSLSKYRGLKCTLLNSNRKLQAVSSSKTVHNGLRGIEVKTCVDENELRWPKEDACNLDDWKLQEPYSKPIFSNFEFITLCSSLFLFPAIAWAQVSDTSMVEVSNWMVDFAKVFSLGFEPLNSDSTVGVRVVVWLDFWLAVIFNVVLPQWLFVWALQEKNEPVIRSNIAYWQACSLFMITVYLQISGWAPAFGCEVLCTMITPTCLWWWQDLNHDIQEGARQGDRLMSLFEKWKYIATGTMIWITVTQTLTHVLHDPSPCALQHSGFSTQLQDPVCSAWLEPEFYFNQILHPALLDNEILRSGFTFLLGVYVLRWIQLLTVEIPKCGRRTYENKISASVALTQFLGILEK